MFKRWKASAAPEEQLGEAVDDDLAEVVDMHFSRPISMDDFKALKGKYLRPANTEWLKVREIPEGIWRRLPQEFKVGDRALQCPGPFVGGLHCANVCTGFSREGEI